MGRRFAGFGCVQRQGRCRDLSRSRRARFASSASWKRQLGFFGAVAAASARRSGPGMAFVNVGLPWQRQVTGFRQCRRAKSLFIDMSFCLNCYIWVPRVDTGQSPFIFVTFGAAVAATPIRLRVRCTTRPSWVHMPNRNTTLASRQPEYSQLLAVVTSTHLRPNTASRRASFAGRWLRRTA
jgi:hypothetical protein